MRKEEVISGIRAEVKSIMEKDSSGHDWLHIERVVRNALIIGEREGADLFIIELAALVHDLTDWKFHGDFAAGDTIRDILGRHGVSEIDIGKVCEIVNTMSFKGKDQVVPMKTLEGKVVQDADRLEALGAVGIARCFAYGGKKGIPIYDPSIEPSFDDYIGKIKGNVKTAMINHFHEKLILLKDMMNTPSGREMAKDRHDFVVTFLEQFYKEVNQ